MNLKPKILEFVEGDNKHSFDALALDIFAEQSVHNDLYKKFLRLLNIDPSKVIGLDDIPCLPIALFKKYAIKTGTWETQQVFKSSGTSDISERSSHHVRHSDFYESLSLEIFKSQYGSHNIEVLALLPSYMESGQSSLIYMARNLMNYYNEQKEAFYMYDFKALKSKIDELIANSSKHIILIGVSFAILDFIDAYPVDNKRLSIVFTGGMKGRRMEVNNSEMYRILKRAAPSSRIDSEYGMTEMFSQAYASNSPQGIFTPGRSLRIMAKQISDPMTNERPGKTAQLAFIDLGNIDTLSFVLTDDLCRIHEDGRFEVLGRLSQSDLRGCNMLYYS